MAEMLQLNSRNAPAESAGLPADSQAQEKHWFALYTAYRQERRVADHLANRAIEHYFPSYRARHGWNAGLTAASDRPVFPGYVFVRIAPQERIPVLEVPGALWIVGNSSSRPTPLPELEINTLRAGLDPLRVEPHPYLTVGQRARVRAGMLAGMEGIVVERKNTLRLVISLEIIMQSIAVEIPAHELEAIGQPAALAGASTFRLGELAFCKL